jgi:hypothetical protein
LKFFLIVFFKAYVCDNNGEIVPNPWLNQTPY